MRFTWQPGPTALAALVTLLNAAKPAAVDDTAYLLFARHLAARPLDPYGFDLFWYSRPEPAMHVLLPPVVPYWLALGIALFGEHLVLLKLWLFPFALALAHSVHFLLRRFARGMERDGTLLMTCSPFVLPLFGVMLDVPAVALGLAAVALFVRGCDGSEHLAGVDPSSSLPPCRGGPGWGVTRGSEGRIAPSPDSAPPTLTLPHKGGGNKTTNHGRLLQWGWVLAAGVVAGAAAQTKYTMIAVPVVLVWYGLLHRRLAMAAVASAVAAVAFAGWEAWLVQKYGESHFLFHARDQGGPGSSEVLSEWLRAKSALFQPLVGYLGGLGLVWGLYAARALGYGNRVALPVGIVAAVGILAVCALPYSDSILLEDRVTRSIRLDLPTLVFCSLGTGVLLTATVVAVSLGVRVRGRPRLRMNPDARFLIGWLAIEFAAYFALTPFPAGRRVIGLCVVIGLVACRYASRIVRTDPSRRPGRWITAFGVTLALGLFALDAWDAVPERDLVERSARVIGDHGRGRIWTQGHWGWQYYADRQGWTLIQPGVSLLRIGDILVQPRLPEKDGIPDEAGFYRPYHGEAKYLLDPTALEAIAEFVWDDPIAGQTIPNLYGGTVPVVGRDHPRLRVVVYRVTRDWTPRSVP